MGRIWLLLFTCCTSGTFALSSFDLNGLLLASRDNSEPTQRSIWNIIWSCLATLFACTWIAVHPNISQSTDSDYAVYRRRLKTMLCMLIAPEFVLFWAIRQWWAAKLIAKETKDKGWNQTHGYFILMGGFILCSNGEELYSLDIDQLRSLSSQGLIDWPAITAREIEDKSKSDLLAKSVVVLQTTWFVVQCIVRAVKRLDVTEIELVTVAFAVLNAGMYFFWWSKPVDVRCAVRVELKRVVTTAGDVETPGHYQNLSGEIDPHYHVGVQHVSIPAGAEANNHALPYPISSPISEKTSPQPTLPASRLKQVIYSPITFLSFIFVSVLNFCKSILRPFREMLTSSTLSQQDKRVPEFYSYVPPTFRRGDQWDRGAIFCTLLIAMIFGAIHCIAWNFDFPTTIEKAVWRHSTLAIMIIPLVTQLLGGVVNLRLVMNFNMQRREGKSPAFFLWTVIYVPLLVLYIVARLALLILPLATLRRLPPGAYLDVGWLDMIPHV